MHIALVAPEFPPEVGGMQTYGLEVAKELVSRGHRVTVFTRRRAESQARLPGVQVRGTLIGRYSPDLAQFRTEAADAWHVLNAAYAWVALHFEPTVISVHGNDFLRPYIRVGEPDLARVPGLWRAQRLRAAIESAVGAWRTPRLMRAGLRRAAWILANSRYTERVFLERFPACTGRTCAAMVGVSAEMLCDTTPKVPGSVKRLITVCRLSERRKNVDLVLRALAQLKDRYAYSYTIVGDGELRPELEALAASLGLADRVRFAGFVPGEALRSHLVQSDLFVMTASVNPVSHEGFGIAYLEANACGTPTLAARQAGAAEAVEDGVSGFFTNSLAVEDVADALERFLAGEVTFAPQACRAFARQFTWAKVVEHAIPWYSPRQTAGANRADALRA